MKGTARVDQPQFRVGVEEQQADVQCDENRCGQGDEAMDVGDSGTVAMRTAAAQSGPQFPTRPTAS